MIQNETQASYLKTNRCGTGWKKVKGWLINIVLFILALRINGTNVPLILLRMHAMVMSVKILNPFLFVCLSYGSCV